MDHQAVEKELWFVSIFNGSVCHITSFFGFVMTTQWLLNLDMKIWLVIINSAWHGSCLTWFLQYIRWRVSCGRDGYACGKERVEQYLEENDGCLVVLEDVQPSHLESVQDNARFRKGHTIATTTATEYPSSLDLKELEPSGAKAMLLFESNHAVTSKDHQWLSVLCGDDGEQTKQGVLRYPLEIVIAGAFLTNNLQLSLREFSSKLLEKIDLSMDLNEDVGDLSMDLNEDVIPCNRTVVMQGLLRMICETIPVGVRLVLFCCAFPNCGPMPVDLLHKILRFPRAETWVNPDLPPKHGQLVTESEVDDLISCALKTRLLEEDKSAGNVILDTLGKFDPVECGKKLVMKPLVPSSLWSMIPPSFLAGMTLNYTSGLLEYLDNISSHDPSIIAALKVRVVKFCELLRDKAPLYLFGVDTVDKILELLDMLARNYKYQNIEILKELLG